MTQAFTLARCRVCGEVVCPDDCQKCACETEQKEESKAEFAAKIRRFLQTIPEPDNNKRPVNEYLHQLDSAYNYVIDLCNEAEGRMV